MRIHCFFFLFVWFDSLRPINNLSVIKGRVFLGWTSTKLGLMFSLKDTTQWSRWDSNPRPFGLESSTLPLSHCAPYTLFLLPLKTHPNLNAWSCSSTEPISVRTEAQGIDCTTTIKCIQMLGFIQVPQHSLTILKIWFKTMSPGIKNNVTMQQNNITMQQTMSLCNKAMSLYMQQNNVTMQQSNVTMQQNSVTMQQSNVTRQQNKVNIKNL